MQDRTVSRAALALIAVSFAGALGAAAPAAATPGYDGLWESVVIMTQKRARTCDRSYRYPVRISNGAVQNDGPSLINVSGKVGGNGAVPVLVSAGDKSATGIGKLSGKVGGGKWSGGECARHLGSRASRLILARAAHARFAKPYRLRCCAGRKTRAQCCSGCRAASPSKIVIGRGARKDCSDNPSPPGGTAWESCFLQSR